MKTPIFTILAVFITAITLLIFNEYTHTALLRDSTYFFILAAMLLGNVLDKLRVNTLEKSN
jgi:hypothetical protein